MLPASMRSNPARQQQPRSRVHQESALRGESVTTAFARRKNAIAISSCGQLENRMILSIVSASHASAVVSFSSFRVCVRCCFPEEFPISQSYCENLRSQSCFCGIKFHLDSFWSLYIYWIPMGRTCTSISAWLLETPWCNTEIDFKFQTICFENDKFSKQTVNFIVEIPPCLVGFMGQLVHKLYGSNEV